MKGFQRRKLTNCWGNIFKIKKKHSSKYKYLVEVIKIGWKQIVLSMKGKTERKKIRMISIFESCKATLSEPNHQNMEISISGRL